MIFFSFFWVSVWEIFPLFWMNQRGENGESIEFLLIYFISHQISPTWRDLVWLALSRSPKVFSLRLMISKVFWFLVLCFQVAIKMDSGNKSENMEVISFTRRPWLVNCICVASPTPLQWLERTTPPIHSKGLERSWTLGLLFSFNVHEKTLGLFAQK